MTHGMRELRCLDKVHDMLELRSLDKVHGIEEILDLDQGVVSKEGVSCINFSPIGHSILGNLIHSSWAYSPRELWLGFNYSS